MEKIKICVDQHTYDIILKDAENFEFYKKDGITFNKNALLNNIIINYHEDFSKNQDEMIKYFRKTINSNTFLNDEQVKLLSSELVRGLNKVELQEKNENFTCVLNLKPTIASIPIIEYIEAYLLNGCGVSEYFRNLLVSYTKLPQDMRELIIFRENFSVLSEAEKLHKKVFITTNNEIHKKFEASIYKIESSKEEMHHYVLTKIKEKLFPLRLSRINSVKLLLEDTNFSEEEIAIFNKMMKYGPQYQYKLNEEEVKIYLTESGIKKYRNMYVHRPVASKIDGSYYYFNCSHTQIIQYFVRFGKDAFVIYPKEVQNKILDFYSVARNVYMKKINNKIDKNK